MHRTWYLPLIWESIPFTVLKTSNNVQPAFSFLLFCLMSNFESPRIWERAPIVLSLVKTQTGKESKNLWEYSNFEGERKKKEKKKSTVSECTHLFSACQRMGQEDHWSLRPYYQPQQHKKTLLRGEGGARALGMQTSWWRACLYL